MSIEDTLAERGSRYGDFTDHAQLSDDLQTRCESSPNWSRLPAWQRWGLRIILDKIARMLTGDPSYADNAHDIVGYGKLIEDRLIAEEKRKANGPGLFDGPTLADGYRPNTLKVGENETLQNDTVVVAGVRISESELG